MIKRPSVFWEPRGQGKATRDGFLEGLPDRCLKEGRGLGGKRISHRRDSELSQTRNGLVCPWLEKGELGRGRSFGEWNRRASLGRRARLSEASGGNGAPAPYPSMGQGSFWPFT